jgi:hypothetical protein
VTKNAKIQYTKSKKKLAEKKTPKIASKSDKKKQNTMHFQTKKEAKKREIGKFNK